MKNLMKNWFTKINKEAFVFDIINSKGKKDKIIINYPNQNTIIEGMAGCGKTHSIVLPIIKNAIKKEYAGLIFDYKNELTAFVNHESDKYVHSILSTINFNEVDKSIRINPLDINENTAQNMDLRLIIIEFLSQLNNNEELNIYYSDIFLAAIEFFRKYSIDNNVKYCTMPHIIAAIINHPKELLEKINPYLETKSPADFRTFDEYKMFFDDLSTVLIQYYNVDFFWIMSKSEIDFRLNDLNKINFVSLIPNTDKEESNPIYSLIINKFLTVMNTGDYFNNNSLLVCIDELEILKPNRVLYNYLMTNRDRRICTVLSCNSFKNIKIHNVKALEKQIVLECDNTIFKYNKNENGINKVGEFNYNVFDGKDQNSKKGVGKFNPIVLPDTFYVNNNEKVNLEIFNHKIQENFVQIHKDILEILK